MKKIEWSLEKLFAVALLCLLVPWAGSLSAADRAGLTSVKSLTRSASYVFRGTVRRTGAANLSIVEPDARTAVVRVDEVLKSSGTLDDFTGTDVTVFLSRDLKPGDQAVFFTDVRLLGESLGLQELGRASGSAKGLATQVKSARGELLREDLAVRLAGADLVVSGRVVSTRPTYLLPRLDPITEHDPLWWEAVLEVRSVLKGKAVEKTVSFQYPSSQDVMWAQVPKPSAGDEGTWLLHRQAPENGAPVYAAVDRQDLLSGAEAKVAAALAKP